MKNNFFLFSSILYFIYGFSHVAAQTNTDELYYEVQYENHMNEEIQEKRLFGFSSSIDKSENWLAISSPFESSITLYKKEENFNFYQTIEGEEDFKGFFGYDIHFYNSTHFMVGSPSNNIVENGNIYVYQYNELDKSWRFNQMVDNSQIEDFNFGSNLKSNSDLDFMISSSTSGKSYIIQPVEDKWLIKKKIMYHLVEDISSSSTMNIQFFGSSPSISNTFPTPSPSVPNNFPTTMNNFPTPSPNYTDNYPTMMNNYSTPSPSVKYNETDDYNWNSTFMPTPSSSNLDDDYIGNHTFIPTFSPSNIHDDDYFYNMNDTKPWYPPYFEYDNLTELFFIGQTVENFVYDNSILIGNSMERKVYYFMVNEGMNIEFITSIDPNNQNEEYDGFGSTLYMLNDMIIVGAPYTNNGGELYGYMIKNMNGTYHYGMLGKLPERQNCDIYHHDDHQINVNQTFMSVRMVGENNTTYEPYCNEHGCYYPYYRNGTDCGKYGCFYPPYYENTTYPPYCNDEGCYYPPMNGNNTYYPYCNEHGCYYPPYYGNGTEHGNYTHYCNEHGCYYPPNYGNETYPPNCIDSNCENHYCDSHGCYYPPSYGNGTYCNEDGSYFPPFCNEYSCYYPPNYGNGTYPPYCTERDGCYYPPTNGNGTYCNEDGCYYPPYCNEYGCYYPPNYGNGTYCNEYGCHYPPYCIGEDCNYYCQGEDCYHREEIYICDPNAQFGKSITKIEYFSNNRSTMIGVGVPGLNIAVGYEFIGGEVISKGKLPIDTSSWNSFGYGMLSTKDELIITSPYTDEGRGMFMIVYLNDANQYQSMNSTSTPTMTPTMTPTFYPTSLPTNRPTLNNKPTNKPSTQPTFYPSSRPTVLPTARPSSLPSSVPTSMPSSVPTSRPTGRPTSQPTSMPSAQPSSRPTGRPTSQPTSMPSAQPSSRPTGRPTSQPTSMPSTQPSSRPTGIPTNIPSGRPTIIPSTKPSMRPSGVPSGRPSLVPSSRPSMRPSGVPTGRPSGVPSTKPSMRPSGVPTGRPSGVPSTKPSIVPTINFKTTTKPSLRG